MEFILILFVTGLIAFVSYEIGKMHKSDGLDDFIDKELLQLERSYDFHAPENIMTTMQQALDKAKSNQDVVFMGKIETEKASWDVRGNRSI